MLLRLPVRGEIGGRPELGAVVDGNGSDEREEDGGDLDGEGDSGKMTGKHSQVFERQQQKQVQESGGRHPEGHNLPEEPGEGGADRDVHFEGLPIEGGMGEGGDVELAATHQAEDHDR